MADYPLTLTASEIDAALQKAHNPDTDLTETAINDPSLVTSGAVKNYVDTITSGGITPSSLGTNLDTAITSNATDSSIPTTKAVVDYVGNNYNIHTNNSQWNITTGNGNLPRSRSWTVQGSITPGVYLIALTFQSNMGNNGNTGTLTIKAGSQTIKSSATSTSRAWTNVGNAGSFSTVFIPTGGTVTATSTLSGANYNNRYLYIRYVKVYAVRIAHV